MPQGKGKIRVYFQTYRWANLHSINFFLSILEEAGGHGAHEREMQFSTLFGGRSYGVDNSPRYCGVPGINNVLLTTYMLLTTRIMSCRYICDA